MLTLGNHAQGFWHLGEAALAFTTFIKAITNESAIIALGWHRAAERHANRATELLNLEASVMVCGVDIGFAAAMVGVAIDTLRQSLAAQLVVIAVAQLAHQQRAKQGGIDVKLYGRAFAEATVVAVEFLKMVHEQRQAEPLA